MFYMGSVRRKEGAGRGRARAEGIDDLVTACPSVECCASGTSQRLLTALFLLVSLVISLVNLDLVLDDIL